MRLKLSLDEALQKGCKEIWVLLHYPPCGEKQGQSPFIELMKAYPVTRVIYGHLHGEEKQLKALEEARRITKEGGVILVAYYMNDYCVVSYGFKDNHIKESLEKGKLNKDFVCTHNEDDLYEPVTVSYINYLLSKTKLERIKLVGVDGPTDYMRQVINAMDEDTFCLFKQYCLLISERQEMIGACSHTLDILKK